MSAVLEDTSVSWKTPSPTHHPPINESVALDVFEWYSNSSVQPQEINLRAAGDLIDRDKDTSLNCSLRIVIFPSRDPNSLAEQEALEAIYRHYSFPSCWKTEGLDSVVLAFGTQQSPTDKNVDLAWLRLTCKNVPTRKTKRVGDIQFLEIGEVRAAALGGSQDSRSWWHLDVLLHVRIDGAGGSKCVTLFCFSKAKSTHLRFQQLLQCDSWMDMIEQPYLLFSILLEKWYRNLEDMGWNLADVFRPIELWTLQHASRKHIVGSKKSDNDDIELDFTGLHNLSKHCTYLLEAAEAALIVLESMTTHHRFVHSNGNGTPLSNTTSISLAYRKTTLQSIQLRLRSLDKRMANLISLSFNLVTQEDSRTMQTDSNAMKAIGVLTLIFLPLTGIGSIFSTPFFDIDFDSQTKVLQVARCFWIFWVITIPLTVLLFLSWVLWYYKTKSRRMGRERKVHGEDSKASRGRDLLSFKRFHAGAHSSLHQG